MKKIEEMTAEELIKHLNSRKGWHGNQYRSACGKWLNPDDPQYEDVECSPFDMIRTLEKESEEHPTVYAADRRIKKLLKDAANMIGNLQSELIKSQIRNSQYRKSEELSLEEFKGEEADKERAQKERDQLLDAIRTASLSYEKLRWGWDGDCGADKIMDELESHLPENQ